MTITIVFYHFDFPDSADVIIAIFADDTALFQLPINTKMRSTISCKVRYLQQRLEMLTYEKKQKKQICTRVSYFFLTRNKTCPLDTVNGEITKPDMTRC